MKNTCNRATNCQPTKVYLNTPRWGRMWFHWMALSLRVHRRGVVPQLAMKVCRETWAPWECKNLTLRDCTSLLHILPAFNRDSRVVNTTDQELVLWSNKICDWFSQLVLGWFGFTLSKKRKIIKGVEVSKRPKIGLVDNVERSMDFEVRGKNGSLITKQRDYRHEMLS